MVARMAATWSWGPVALALLGLSGVALAYEELNETTAEEVVGTSKFEANLMALAKVGMYELTFYPKDLESMLAEVHPFSQTYRESDENLVMLDEYPYVPEIWFPFNGKNTSITLSNMVAHQHFDPKNIHVEFHPGWQSLFFLDMSLNVTVDWKLNDRPACYGGFRELDIDGPCGIGRATIRVPHAWLHQNIEAQCYQASTSILSWESRCDMDIGDIDITTAVRDKDLLDGFAEALHSSRILKKYLSIGIQHQLARVLGSVHWASQSRLRDLCLNCHKSISSSERLQVTFSGQRDCLGNMPSFFWHQDFGQPKEVQGVAAEAIRDLLKQQWVDTPKKHSDRVIRSPEELEQLTPKVDPRRRFAKKELPEGFVDDRPKPSPQPVPEWKQMMAHFLLGKDEKDKAAKEDKKDKSKEGKDGKK